MIEIAAGEVTLTLYRGSGLHVQLRHALYAPGRALVSVKNVMDLFVVDLELFDVNIAGETRDKIHVEISLDEVNELCVPLGDETCRKFAGEQNIQIVTSWGSWCRWSSEVNQRYEIRLQL